MLDVAFTRAEVRRTEVAVVIDVLRATTTITHALQVGYRRVLVTDELEHALTLRGPDRVLAGERDCVAPPGFDLGNSPQETDPPRGSELVLATTNGGPTIVAAGECADTVLLGCVRNLDALCEAIAGEDVQLVCAGTDGGHAVEDVYLAGRICARLDGPRSDAALIAQTVAAAHPSAREAIGAGRGARNLVDARLGGDIDFCAQESVSRTIPRMSKGGGRVVELCADRHLGADQHA